MLEAPEPLETINQRLIDTYGRHENGLATWRVVWSTNEMETRLGNNGFELMAKYPWSVNRWILERIMPVPEIQRHELTAKLSYEPIWVFETNRGDPLPYKWEAIEVIIKTVHENAAKAVGVSYKDPDIGSNPDETLELRVERLNKLQRELFGNETEVGDSLAHGYGIVVPSNYEKVH